MLMTTMILVLILLLIASLSYLGVCPASLHLSLRMTTDFDIVRRR